MDGCGRDRRPTPPSQPPPPELLRPAVAATARAARAMARAAIPSLPHEVWVLILALAAATEVPSGVGSGITARRMARMGFSVWGSLGWAFREAAGMHPDLMPRPLSAARAAADQAWWAAFRLLYLMKY